MQVQVQDIDERDKIFQECAVKVPSFQQPFLSSRRVFHLSASRTGARKVAREVQGRTRAVSTPPETEKERKSYHSGVPSNL